MQVIWTISETGQGNTQRARGEIHAGNIRRALEGRPTARAEFHVKALAQRRRGEWVVNEESGANQGPGSRLRQPGRQVYGLNNRGTSFGGQAACWIFRYSAFAKLDPRSPGTLLAFGSKSKGETLLVMLAKEEQSRGEDSSQDLRPEEGIESKTSTHTTERDKMRRDKPSATNRVTTLLSLSSSPVTPAAFSSLSLLLFSPLLVFLPAVGGDLVCLGEQSWPCELSCNGCGSGQSCT